MKLAVVGSLAFAVATPATAHAGPIFAARTVVHHWAKQGSATSWGVTRCRPLDARITLCYARESGIKEGDLTYYLTVRRLRGGGYVVVSGLWLDRVVTSGRCAC
jgi:hypothetical protein